ncbi:MAG: hypothetical protein M3188_07595 [Actinomycetota bacterium]|nr:hypothetical protein [Actinomycetota bacterium]
MSARQPIAAVALAAAVCLAVPGVAIAQEQAPPAPVELWKTYPLDPTGGQGEGGDQGASQPGPQNQADASGRRSPPAAPPASEAQSPSANAPDEGGAVTRALLVTVGVVLGLLVLLALLVAAARSGVALGDPRGSGPRVRARVRELARSARRLPERFGRVATISRSVAAATMRASRSAVQRLREASARGAGLGRPVAAASVSVLRQPARSSRLELATAGPPPPNARTDAVTDLLVAADAGGAGPDEASATEPPGKPSRHTVAAREHDDARGTQTPKQPTSNEELVTLKEKARVGARARPDAAPKEAQGDGRDDVEILKEKAARSKRAKTRNARPKRPSTRAARAETLKDETGSAQRRPDAPAKTAAAPSREVAAEAPAAECEIVWWRGFSTSQFLAVHGDDLVASSPFFASSESDQLKKSPEAVRALEALVETLEQDGWSVGERGREWFRLRMRHTAPPKSMGRVEEPDWRQRDEREGYGNHSTV